MTWDWNIGVIIAMLAVNVIGWAFTLGKSAGKARSGDERVAEQTKVIAALQVDCKEIDKTLAVVGNRVLALENCINNGLTASVVACNLNVAKLQEQVIVRARESEDNG